MTGFNHLLIQIRDFYKGISIAETLFEFLGL
jgi:hypothetical protein